MIFSSRLSGGFRAILVDQPAYFVEHCFGPRFWRGMKMLRRWSHDCDLTGNGILPRQDHTAEFAACGVAWRVQSRQRGV